VTLALGGDGVAMGSVLTAAAVEPVSVDPSAIQCDICHAYSGQLRSEGNRKAGLPARQRVLRFDLEHHPKGKIGRGRHVGSIRLCDQCWKGLNR
jgi:hypothetical protein